MPRKGFLTLTIAILLIQSAQAATQYTCVEEKTFTVSWNPGSDSVDVETFEAEKPPQVATLIVDGEQVRVIRLSRVNGEEYSTVLQPLTEHSLNVSTFLESDLAQFKLIKTTHNGPIFLYRQSATNLMSPRAATEVYRCRLHPTS